MGSQHIAQKECSLGDLPFTTTNFICSLPVRDEIWLPARAGNSTSKNNRWAGPSRLWHPSHQLGPSRLSRLVVCQRKSRSQVSSARPTSNFAIEVRAAPILEQLRIGRFELCLGLDRPNCR